MDTLKTPAPAYTDLSGLSKLKRAAGKDDPKAIRAVAEQFEAMFTRMMLKSMRDAVGKDPMFGSDQQQMYQDMADSQLSIQMAKGKGLGLADMLVRQLQKMGVKGANHAAGATEDAASAGGTSGDGAATGPNGPAGAGAARAAAAAYSATQRAFATGAASNITSSASEAVKSSFVQDLWPQAEQAGQLLGVDPRHLIAQAALETNWGRNIPHDTAGACSNNLFGMKVSTDWSGAAVNSITQEFQNGVAANTTAQFKAYATPAESFGDYVTLLRTNPRYSAALNTGSNVQAFASGLQRGGYATDPNYANKIAAVATAVSQKVTAAHGGVNDLKLSASMPISAGTGAL